jgi:uncharacterized protein (TIGR02453 family)
MGRTDGGAASTGFSGFSDRALELYAGLEADNSREYWAQHKSEWEAEVRDPMRALLAALEDEFGAAKMFRPNRDVRFSKDKAPYKTHQGALVPVSEDTLGVGFYVQVGAEGLLAGGGWRSHGADEVARYRAAVDTDPGGAELERLVRRLEKAGFAIEGDRVATRPRGVPADHPRLELMRARSLMVFRRFGAPDWLATQAALDEVRGAWRAVRPLAGWVAEAVLEGRRDVRPPE